MLRHKRTFSWNHSQLTTTRNLKCEVQSRIINKLKAVRGEQHFSLNCFPYINHVTHPIKATHIKTENNSLFLSRNILGVQFLHSHPILTTETSTFPF